MVHPALLNADIVSLISEVLEEDEDWLSLTALARTARFLQDPALRELWRDISGFSRLLSPFGSSITSNDQGKLYFCSNPTSTQWDRFKFYAQFVRTFMIQDQDAIEPSSLLILSSHQTLLPRLKSLGLYSPWNGHAISALKMFFVPSIQSFSVYSCRDSVAFESLLVTLGVTTSALQSLHISSDPDSQLPTDKFATSISAFHKLSSIAISLTSLNVHSILSHLSTLPLLSRIRLTIIDLTGTSGAGSKYPFPAARELIICSESDDQPTYFLTMTSFDNLTDLRISCENYLIDDHSLCTAISIACSHQSLNQISIGNGKKDPKSMKVSTLDPLSKFTNIRSVSFTIAETVWPTCEDIPDIAKTWPRLENLCLDPAFVHEDRYPLTLTGLVPLIENCPKLMVIKSPVDARQVPKFTKPIRRPGLYIAIATWDSLIDDPKSVANFLSLALPDADIEAFAFDMDETYRLWNEALTIRERLIKGRKKRGKTSNGADARIASGRG